jgi:transcriptional regulator with XRE-family HTH domain
MTLGDKIQQARQAKRMTLRALARAIGVSAPFMSDVEHNRRALTDERVEQVAKALGIDARELRSLNGLSRELKDWIRNSPELVQLLQQARDTHRPLIIGGDMCPCCGRRWSHD